MIQRQEALQEEARVIERIAQTPGNRVPRDMLDTLRAGNAAERNAVTDGTFAQVPLRLAGLEPDDASGRIWTGSADEISASLHQARRVGLSVEIVTRDWKGGEL